MMYEEVDLMRVDEFLGMAKRFEEHNKGKDVNTVKLCDSCAWMLPKLKRLQNMMNEYAKMRKTDDDVIEWNTLILELLNYEDENSQDIKHQSIKVKKEKKKGSQKSKEVEGNKQNDAPKADPIGKEIERLMVEQKEIAESDDIYNVEMDSWDDEKEQSSEDQGDEQEDEVEGDVDGQEEEDVEEQEENDIGQENQNIDQGSRTLKAE